MTQRTQYSSAILPGYRPVDASNVLRSRLSAAEPLNASIADWFAERARVEEAYADKLEKLANKAIASELSTPLQSAWESVLQSTRDSAHASSVFVGRLQRDVERPLRQFNKSPPWGDAKVLHSEFDSLAHSLQSQSDKVDKLIRKPAKQQLDVAQRLLEDLRAQWENQAPYIMDQIETIDENRLGHIKNALTTFGTVQADCSAKVSKASEGALSGVLAFEPVDDITAYAAQVGKAATAESVRPSSPSIHSAVRNGSFSDGSILGQTSTNRSDSLHELPATSSPSKLRSKVGSIFRSSKRKNKISSSTPPPPPVSEVPGSGSGSGVPYSPTFAARGQNQTRTNGERGAPSHLNPGIDSSSQGGTVFGARKPPPPPARKGGPVAPVSAGSREHRFEPNLQFRSLPDTPEEEPESDIVRGNVPVAAAVDDEDEPLGNRASRFNIDIQPSTISPSGDDDIALSVVASQLRARKTMSGRGYRGRRDIQSTYFNGIAPAGIETSPLSPLREPEVPLATAITTDAPSPEHTQVNQVEQAQQTLTSEPTGTAAHVIPTLQHPSMPSNPGLNATFVQTISAIVRDGALSRATLVGELAFGYTGPVGHSLDLHVGNLNAFDQIVPSEPSFISPIDPAAGTFKLDTNFLDGRYGNVVTGLKVVSQSAQDFIPIEFTPIWRIEASQSSLILSYKVSSGFLEESSFNHPLVLHDLVITIPVEGGTATSALSKPHAVFNKTKQRIVWKFAQPVAVHAGVENKLLCRFATEGGAVREAAKGISVSFRTAPTTGVSASGGGKHDVPLHYNEQGEWKPVSTAVCITTGQFLVQSQDNVQDNS